MELYLVVTLNHELYLIRYVMVCYNFYYWVCMNLLLFCSLIYLFPILLWISVLLFFFLDLIF